MVLKPPGAAKTPKTIDFQPNPKTPSAKPPLATAEHRLIDTGHAVTENVEGTVLLKSCTCDSGTRDSGSSDTDLAQIWCPLGGHPGYLKAVWLKIFGPVLLGFKLEIDPETPQIVGAGPVHRFARKISPADQF